MAPITLGQFVQQRRLELKLDQQKLSLLCHCDRTYINKLEIGLMKKPSLEVLKALSEILKVDFNLICLYADYCPPSLKEQLIEIYLSNKKFSILIED